MILGLGSDGHIASLFPGSVALRERSRWVLSVAGSEKATAVAQALAPPGDPRIEPAANLAFARREVVWWLDRAAAEQLESRP